MGLLTPLAIRIGRMPWLPRLLPQIVWVDLQLQRLSGGRATLLDIAGLPNVMLTVIGRKSGLPRTSPLLAVPYRHTYLIAGSNFGGTREPDWAQNLEATPAGTVAIHGKSHAFTARLVDGDERARLWQVMVATWPNYATYQERTTRTIKVFALSLDN